MREIFEHYHHLNNLRHISMVARYNKRLALKMLEIETISYAKIILRSENEL